MYESIILYTLESLCTLKRCEWHSVIGKQGYVLSFMLADIFNQFAEKLFILRISFFNFASSFPEKQVRKQNQDQSKLI